MKTCRTCEFFQKRDREGQTVNFGTCNEQPPFVAFNILPSQGLQGVQPMPVTNSYRPQVLEEDVACSRWKPILLADRP